MKKTFSVSLENEHVLIALMNDLQFEEVGRIATGGMMSPPQLLLTFEGDEDNYHENGYVVVPSDRAGYSTYHSLIRLDGHFTNDISQFIKYHKSLLRASIEVKKLP